MTVQLSNTIGFKTALSTMDKPPKQVRYVSKARLEVTEVSGKTLNIKLKLLAILTEIYANDNTVQFKDTHGTVINLKAVVRIDILYSITQICNVSKRRKLATSLNQWHSIYQLEWPTISSLVDSV